MPARKLTFQEVWESATVFFVDNNLENEIDQKIDDLLELANHPLMSQPTGPTVEQLVPFLQENINRLDVILRDVGLSDEKFMRIISLLRRLGLISGGFESEWSNTKIKRLMQQNPEFLYQIVQLLFNGKNNSAFQPHIPRFYLEKLNYQEIGSFSPAARKERYKDASIGTYGGRKGYYVEKKIAQKLQTIQQNYGITYEQGNSRFIDVNIDFAIPSLDDPWVIIMSSFQETTSSGQTNKARNMREAFERINQSNSRHRENRAFVNFVDGGGWLARRQDLERLVEDCHYFLNLNYLDMLEEIVLQHIPAKHRR